MNEKVKVGAIVVGLIGLILLGRWLLPKEEIVYQKEADYLVENDIFVDIEGCVSSPGLLKVPYGTRVFEAIEQVGGATEEADLSRINLAMMLKDEQKIIVPPKVTQEEEEEEGLVNINTASLEKLQTLSGIGEGTAKKIIQYREKNGYFSAIEELMQVSGIGQNKFEGLKDEITI